MALSQDLFEKVQYWSLSESFDPETRQEVRNLVEGKHDKELTDRFYRDLEFGTGGMRGLMGAGSSRINVYNIRRATKALALYLRELYGSEPIRVAISYDSRNNSRLYAESVAELLAANKIHSTITKTMRPVPMLSFMVRHFSCQAGVCITASHNPSGYNGFKVYWKCGGQLIPPHDAKIFAFYESLKDYSQLSFLPFNQACKESWVTEVEDELDVPYFEKLRSLSMFSKGRDLKIVYSPLHGTGIYAVPRALRLFGFENLSIVQDQASPDGNFPTVSSPNPEDPRSLEMALKLGSSLAADILLATDPDADRLAVIVREDQEWVNFTGNQMGALLFEYTLSQLQAKKQLPKNALTIKTVVTSDLLKDISQHYGASCEETLTGFKWICKLVESYESGELKPHKQFICGAEESYGFLADTFVRDKDAILSAVIATEMLAYYRSLGKKLSGVLDQIYQRHGFYYEKLETITLPGKDGDEKIKNIMRTMRANPPKKLGQFEIESIKDYSLGIILQKHGQSFERSGSIDLPKSDVLQFICKDLILTIRPSGTEPKIKVYLSMRSAITKDLESAKKQTTLEADSLFTNFLGIVSSL